MQRNGSVKWHGFVIFLVLCILLSGTAICQSVLPNPQSGRVPFEKWMAEGPRQQLPWKVMLWPERLSSHQRLLSYIEIFVPGKELIKRSGKGRLIASVQVTDSLGHVYRMMALSTSIPAIQRQKTWMHFLPGERLYCPAITKWRWRSMTAKPASTT